MTFPLEAVVLFPRTPPPAPELREELSCAMDSSGRERGESIEVWTLPVEPPWRPAPEEPGASALLLHCRASWEPPPWARPAVYRRALGILAEAGALAVWLPAAMKWLRAPPLRGLGVELVSRDVMRDTLLTRHVVIAGDEIWIHTHGMAHFALPDLECRVSRSEGDDGERLVDGAIDYLLDGGDALSVGTVSEVYEGVDAIRFGVAEAESRADHAYGVFGAWTLQVMAFPGRAAMER
ncbi:hypothetical protein [Sorangium sp. So ce394]|uniref:hypothetical protein n=1 Tax=Sorangium sp. So ce394 TaxID=3133310 RepID=UPI003F5C663D